MYQSVDGSRCKSLHICNINSVDEMMEVYLCSKVIGIDTMVNKILNYFCLWYLKL